MEINNQAVNKDLLPHIKTCLDHGKEFIRNQAEGELWIIPGIVSIKYATNEADIDVSLSICGVEIDKACIEISNPVCKLEGYVGIAKGSFSLNIDVANKVLTVKGIACFKGISGNSQWQCLPEKTWNLLHF